MERVAMGSAAVPHRTFVAAVGYAAMEFVVMMVSVNDCVDVVML